MNKWCPTIVAWSFHRKRKGSIHLQNYVLALVRDLRWICFFCFFNRPFSSPSPFSTNPAHPCRAGVASAAVRTRHQDGLCHQCHLLHGLRPAQHAAGALPGVPGERLLEGQTRLEVDEFLRSYWACVFIPPTESPGLVLLQNSC